MATKWIKQLFKKKLLWNHWSDFEIVSQEYGEWGYLHYTDI